MEFHQFDTVTGTISVTLLPGENISGTMKENSVPIVDGRLVDKDGVKYDVVDGRSRREVVKPFSKHPDAQFK